VGSLLDGIASRPAAQRGSKCGVALAIASLDEFDRSDLLAALAGPYSPKAICEGLAKHGVAVRPYTIARHRRHDCRCEQ